MTVSFEYDDAAAAQGDREPISTGPYVGKFTHAAYLSNAEGSEGIEFTFEGPGQGTARFKLWTKSKEGKKTVGYNQLQAIQFLFNLKGLKSATGKVQAWNDTTGKFEEVDGDVFPELCEKPIGVVLQKEHTSKKSGGDSFRFNLVGQFQPETRLTASEIKEHVTKPTKIDKILKGLKDKDSRKNAPTETAQPSMGYEGME